MNEKQCRKALADRSQGLCERCGQQGHSLHHRRKRSAGGPWSMSNCVWLCGHGTMGCHSWVEHNPNLAREEGFHVRSFEDETVIPVLYQGGWVLLDDDGGMSAAKKEEE